MNKIIKLHETYFDVSKIKSINTKLISKYSEQYEFYIYIDGLETYLGNATTLKDYDKFLSLYNQIKKERDNIQWQRLFDETTIYQNRFSNEMTEKVESFVDIWKTFTNN